MTRLGSRLSVPAVGLCLAAAPLLGLAVEPALAAGKAAPSAPKKVTSIVVTAGKPSDGALKLSKKELIPAGTVAFKVTNSGTIGHSFQICLSPSTDASADYCEGFGQMTRLLGPGQSQTVTVKLAKKGTYEFMGTLAGQTSPVTKGLIGIGVKVKPTPPPASIPVTGSGSSAHTPVVNDPGAAELLMCQITSCDDDE